MPVFSTCAWRVVLACKCSNKSDLVCCLSWTEKYLVALMNDVHQIVHRHEHDLNHAHFSSAAYLQGYLQCHSEVWPLTLQPYRNHCTWINPVIHCPRIDIRWSNSSLVLLFGDMADLFNLPLSSNNGRSRAEDSGSSQTHSLLKLITPTPHTLTHTHIIIHWR